MKTKPEHIHWIPRAVFVTLVYNLIIEPIGCFKLSLADEL